MAKRNIWYHPAFLKVRVELHDEWKADAEATKTLNSKKRQQVETNSRFKDDAKSHIEV